MKITKEIRVVYYVEQDGWIYGGPFDTRAEAQACLKQYQAEQK
jgi:hypothetical protein